MSEQKFNTDELREVCNDLIKFRFVPEESVEIVQKCADIIDQQAALIAKYEQAFKELWDESVGEISLSGTYVKLSYIREVIEKAKEDTTP